MTYHFVKRIDIKVEAATLDEARDIVSEFDDEVIYDECDWCGFNVDDCDVGEAEYVGMTEEEAEEELYLYLTED